MMHNTQKSPAHSTDTFITLSAVVFVLALVQSALGILRNYVSIPTESTGFMLIQMASVMLLVGNSYRIYRYIGQQHDTSTLTRQIAALSLTSIALCFVGDIINCNFSQTYYQYHSVVKHDYLANSVVFFALGYMCIIYAIFKVVRHKQLNKPFLIGTSLIALIIGVLSFAGVYLPNTHPFVCISTGVYAPLITLAGVSGLWLLKAYGAYGMTHAPTAIKWLALGALLAPIADAIIGNFWIYGNAGHGYFPVVRHVNWFIYVGTQAIIQHLPWVVYRLEIDS